MQLLTSCYVFFEEMIYVQPSGFTTLRKPTLTNVFPLADFYTVPNGPARGRIA